MKAITLTLINGFIFFVFHSCKSVLDSESKLVNNTAKKMFPENLKKKVFSPSSVFLLSILRLFFRLRNSEIFSLNHFRQPDRRTRRRCMHACMHACRRPTYSIELLRDNYLLFFLRLRILITFFSIKKWTEKMRKLNCDSKTEVLTNSFSGR